MGTEIPFYFALACPLSQSSQIDLASVFHKVLYITQMPFHSSLPAPVDEVAVHTPRPLCALPVWEVDPWLLKPYLISYESNESGKPIVPEPLLAAGRAEATRHIRTAKLTTPTYGLGFVVLHRSMSGTWLLTGWWAYDNILCTGLSNAPADDAPFTIYKGPIRACVHELAVVEHERRTWIDTMMTGHPDPALWAAKRFKEDTC